MENLQNLDNEKNLIEYFQWLRLQTAKTLNDQNIEKSRFIKEEKRTLSGTIKNIGHFFERNVKQYDKKHETLNDDLATFNNRHESHLSKLQAKSIISELFANDKNVLSKLLMAVAVILDDSYNYKYEKEGLEAVSEILYGDTKEIALIKKQLETNYNVISSKSLSSIQKGVLVGVAVMSLASLVTMPILLGAGAGASAATTTAALAAHGFGDMQIGLGIITAESFIMSAALTGIAYGSMKLYNSEKIKQEFKKLNPEKNALYLAIQCTYIQRISKTLNDDEFKSILDEILKNLNVLKSDLDYFLFIENESTISNKQKLKSFHAFDERLIKVLGL